MREDGKEEDVFTLIGPKRFDVPWKVLETQGWIATAECLEVRVPLPDEMRMEYAVADGRSKFRLASESHAKIPVVQQLVQKYAERLYTVGHLSELGQGSNDLGGDAPRLAVQVEGSQDRRGAG